ncbi:MAG: M20 family metallopeptidase [Deltaproteobacteria bacterium]|nr:M20 family metallopeptidase [Deltaproteobacteria bacterium]MCB9788109.1 M20 family metallopeptidase [Deltaproteobacteria bacterium]
MDPQRTRSFVDAMWDDSIVPALVEYIRIPNQSPAFDPEWAEHGHMDRAVALAEAWVRSHAPEGATVEVWRLPGRTPLLFVEIGGELPGTILLYGHLDKQPPMVGWSEGRAPWTPVLRDGRLYGRGGADDGYAVFASIAAARALGEQGTAHPRLVVAIECSEESGSPDLSAYIDAYAQRIGAPDLVVCLDSGCGDYERLWLTTSLRGNIVAELEVGILREGVHSGRASGVVASTFRIARRLLSRIEDPDSGEILLPEFHAEIPEQRVEQARQAAAVLGDEVRGEMPFVTGARAVSDDVVEQLLARTWRPALSVTGADGLPPVAQAGNVLRPSTTLKLSLRTPPTTDAHTAGEALRRALEADPPYGARVVCTVEPPAGGWHAPPLAPWLGRAIDEASEAFFGPKACHVGEGGSIPFMGMLGEKFPEAQFVITGVLGPGSNAHGPNEFLDIATGKRLTAAVAHVIAAFGQRPPA